MSTSNFCSILMHIYSVGYQLSVVGCRLKRHIVQPNPLLKLITISLLSILCLLPPASGNIRFEEVSQQAGITRIGESWGNAWGDFDGDGYLDLWATNHKHKPSLYRNNGDGTFTDIIDEVWDANPHADTHGVAWADFDNDGDQDLIVLSGGGGGTNPTNPKNNNHFCEPMAYYLSRQYKPVISIDRFSMKWSIDASDTPLRFVLRC